MFSEITKHFKNNELLHAYIKQHFGLKFTRKIKHINNLIYKIL